jgi:hypothetical protein
MLPRLKRLLNAMPTEASNAQPQLHSPGQARAPAGGASDHAVGIAFPGIRRCDTSCANPAVRPVLPSTLDPQAVDAQVAAVGAHDPAILPRRSFCGKTDAADCQRLSSSANLL